MWSFACRKAMWRTRGTVGLILNFNNRQLHVDNFTPQPLELRTKCRQDTLKRRRVWLRAGCKFWRRKSLLSWRESNRNTSTVPLKKTILNPSIYA